MAAGQVSPGAAQPDGKTGSVEGVVTSAETGAPVPNLPVFLIGLDQPPPATTDAHGKFRFSQLAVHPYQVDAFTPQYFVSGGMVRVDPGPAAAHLDLKAYRFPVIAGRVRDSLKRPVSGVKVTAIEDGVPHSRYPPHAGASATTDDHGEFRISGLGLRMGRYTLVADMKRLPIHAIRSGEGAKEPEPTTTDVATYYPNSASFDGAAWFAVSPGRLLEGMDLIIARAPTVCVRGRIADPQGKAGREIHAFVDADWYSGGNTVAEGAVHTGEDFQVCGLTAGEYRLSAQYPDSDDVPRYALEPFVAVREPLRLPQSRLIAPPPLRGQLTVVSESGGDAAPFTGSASIWLEPMGRPLHSIRPGQRPAATARQAGPFEIPGVLPDDYWLHVSPPAGHYVKSAMLGGVDVLRNPLHASGGEVYVVLGTGAPMVSVLVVDDDRRPVPGATVLLGQEVEPAELGPGNFRSAVSDQDGSAVFTGIAPGNYRVLALTGLLSLGGRTPAFFVANRSAGERLEVKSKDTATVQVKPRPGGAGY